MATVQSFEELFAEFPVGERSIWIHDRATGKAVFITSCAGLNNRMRQRTGKTFAYNREQGFFYYKFNANEISPICNLSKKPSALTTDLTKAMPQASNDLQIRYTILDDVTERECTDKGGTWDDVRQVCRVPIAEILSDEE